jgi:flagellar hook-basal body complex protein FliE
MNIKNSDNTTYTPEESQAWDNICAKIKALNARGPKAQEDNYTRHHEFTWPWLAGFIDGDGSIYVSIRTGPNRRPNKRPCISINITNLPTIKYMSQIFGVNTHLSNKPTNNKRRTYAINLLTNKINEFAPYLLDHMVLKKQNLIYAYEIAKLRLSLPNGVHSGPMIDKIQHYLNLLHNLNNTSHNLAKELNTIGIKTSNNDNVITINNLFKAAIYDINDTINYSDADIHIFSDEWETKHDIIMSMIKQKLNINAAINIRPQKCQIKLISTREANSIYKQYHYIGNITYSSYNVGIYYNNVLIAAMSLRKPIRQNCTADWEISRMACNTKYRIHGIWSYIINWLKTNNVISGKLITFSDNRISNGNVYQKMGFTKDGIVRPDYYWVKNSIRYNKSTMRKKDFEKATSKTEHELRTEAGYHKIYDLGKIRWITNI